MSLPSFWSAISTIFPFNTIASPERSLTLTAECFDFVEREEIIRKIIYNLSLISIVFLLYFVVFMQKKVHLIIICMKLFRSLLSMLCCLAECVALRLPENRSSYSEIQNFLLISDRIIKNSIIGRKKCPLGPERSCFIGDCDLGSSPNWVFRFDCANLKARGNCMQSLSATDYEWHW